MIGNKYICEANGIEYTVIGIPLAGTGISYLEITDGENNYFVMSGYHLGKYRFMFRSNVTEFNNKKMPPKVKANVDIYFTKV
jgi:hypothetical protein